MQLPKGFDSLAYSLLVVLISVTAAGNTTANITEGDTERLVLNAETQEIQSTLSQFAGTPESPVENTGPIENPSEYFTINEGTRSLNGGFTGPVQLMAEVSARVAPTSGQLPLTQWVLHNRAPQQPPQKYIRKYHFGTWVNDPTDNSCLNTRAKVLVRDSARPVTYKATNHCVVENGLWNDPYTGRQFTSTRDIQIDHVVPLKHAYTTGAFRWDYRTRCHYANFLDNSYHLISVNGHENMSKGDRSPDKYMPPNLRVACGYLQRWLEIKLAWKLVIFPREAEAIRSYIQRFRCNPAQFAMDRNELIRQRIAMTQDLPSCLRTPTLPIQGITQ